MSTISEKNGLCKSNNYLITICVKGGYKFSSMNILLFYGTNKLVIKGVFKGAEGFRVFKPPSPPPRFSDFFLRSEGKEVERKKMKVVNIFFWVNIFSSGVEIFSGGFGPLLCMS